MQSDWPLLTVERLNALQQCELFGGENSEDWDRMSHELRLSFPERKVRAAISSGSFVNGMRDVVESRAAVVDVIPDDGAEVWIRLPMHSPTQMDLLRGAGILFLDPLVWLPLQVFGDLVGDLVAVFARANDLHPYVVNHGHA
jgi:hypothetical protein